MPELPEVETFRKYLDAHALNQVICRSRLDPAMPGRITPRGLSAALEGRKLTSTSRHGKYLFARLNSGRHLIVHFGMTGHLHYYENPSPEPTYTKLRLDFVNGRHLSYVSSRKLGEIALTDNLPGFIEDKGLGPDALAPALNLRAFRSVMSGRSGKIKPLLMNQRVIAGIGNLYADEICYQARIHPETRTDKLDEDAVTSIYTTMRRVLERSVKVSADFSRLPPTWLLPHRQRGSKCPRCRAEFQRIKMGGRTAYFCPACQIRR